MSGDGEHKGQEKSKKRKPRPCFFPFICFSLALLSLTHSAHSQNYLHNLANPTLVKAVRARRVWSFRPH